MRVIPRRVLPFIVACALLLAALAMGACSRVPAQGGAASATSAAGATATEATSASALSSEAASASAGSSASETGGGAEGDEPEVVAYDLRLDSVREDGERLTGAALAAIVGLGADYTESPSEVLQLPELPSGCEIAALASALQSMGYDVEPTEIADEHLVIDGDEYGYLASPYSDIGGGFPPGVAAAANSYLQEQRSDLRAYDLTGSAFAGITALLNAGFPVLVWTTIDQAPPDYNPEYGGTDVWFINEHCMTLYAVYDDVVLVNDPLEGLVELDADTFADVYRQCGQMALYIRPTES